MARYTVTIDDYTFTVELDPFSNRGGLYQVWVDGEPVPVILPDGQGWPDGKRLPSGKELLENVKWVVAGDNPYDLTIDPAFGWIQDQHGVYKLKLRGQGISNQRKLVRGDGHVRAPIPGQITRVEVCAGQRVEAGDLLLGLEAMKMENELHAPCSGTVSGIHILPREDVVRGQLLVEIT